MDQNEPNSGSSGYSGGSGYSSRAESPDSRVSSSDKRDSSSSSQSPQRRPMKRPDSPRQLRKPTATKSPSNSPAQHQPAPQNNRSNGQVDLNDFPDIVEMVKKYTMCKTRNEARKRNEAFITLVDALWEEGIFPESISDYRRDPDGEDTYEYFCTWCLDSLGEYPLEGWLPHHVLAKYCPEFLGLYLGKTHIVQPWRKYEILRYDNGTPRTLLLTQKIDTVSDAVLSSTF